MNISAYVDGLNFYEASKDKQWYPYGWCDWKRTIQNYSPAGAKVTLKYFTSKLSPQKASPNDRQKLHLRAMKEVAKAEIIEGLTQSRNVVCKRCNKLMVCPECAANSKLTEKQTDVNIAIHLVVDAIDKKFDDAFLVTSDIDLIPAVKTALARNAHSQIGILFPPEGFTNSEFQCLESDYPGRVSCGALDLGRMVRFDEGLADQWNMGIAFPKHWRKGAGARPKVVLDNTPTSTINRPVPWWEESRKR